MGAAKHAPDATAATVSRLRAGIRNTPGSRARALTRPSAAPRDARPTARPHAAPPPRAPTPRLRHAPHGTPRHAPPDRAARTPRLPTRAPRHASRRPPVPRWPQARASPRALTPRPSARAQRDLDGRGARGARAQHELLRRLHRAARAAARGPSSCPRSPSLRVIMPAKRFFLPATRTDSRTVAGALTVTRARQAALAQRRSPRARAGADGERELRRRRRAGGRRRRRRRGAPVRLPRARQRQDLLADRAAVLERAERRGVDAVALGPGDPGAVGRERRARERVGVRRLEAELAAERRRRARAGRGEQAQRRRGSGAPSLSAASSSSTAIRVPSREATALVAGGPGARGVVEPRLLAVVAAPTRVERDRRRRVGGDVAAEDQPAVADPGRRDEALLAERLAGEAQVGRGRRRPQRRRVAVDQLVVGDPWRRRARCGRAWASRPGRPRWRRSRRSGSAGRARVPSRAIRCSRPSSSEATSVPSSAVEGHS